MDLKHYRQSKDVSIEDVKNRIKELETLKEVSTKEKNKGYHLIDGHLEINRAMLVRLTELKKKKRVLW